MSCNRNVIHIIIFLHLLLLGFIPYHIDMYYIDFNNNNTEYDLKKEIGNILLLYMFPWIRLCVGLKNRKPLIILLLYSVKPTNMRILLRLFKNKHMIDLKFVNFYWRLFKVFNVSLLITYFFVGN